MIYLQFPCQNWEIRVLISLVRRKCVPWPSPYFYLFPHGTTIVKCLEIRSCMEYAGPHKSHNQNIYPEHQVLSNPHTHTHIYSSIPTTLTKFTDNNSPSFFFFAFAPPL